MMDKDFLEYIVGELKKLDDEVNAMMCSLDEDSEGYKYLAGLHSNSSNIKAHCEVLLDEVKARV